MTILAERLGACLNLTAAARGSIPKSGIVCVPHSALRTR